MFTRQINDIDIPYRYYKQLQILVNNLKVYMYISKIVLFGSYALQTAKDGSDIDLCIIIGGEEIDYKQQEEPTREEVSKTEKELNLTIDLLVIPEKVFYSRLSDINSIQIDIAEDGVLLYQKIIPSKYLYYLAIEQLGAINVFMDKGSHIEMYRKVVLECCRAIKLFIQSKAHYTTLDRRILHSNNIAGMIKLLNKEYPIDKDFNFIRLCRKEYVKDRYDSRPENYTRQLAEQYLEYVYLVKDYIDKEVPDSKAINYLH